MVSRMVLVTCAYRMYGGFLTRRVRALCITRRVRALCMQGRPCAHVLPLLDQSTGGGWQVQLKHNCLLSQLAQ
jgi:hypothetical protein